MQDNSKLLDSATRGEWTLEDDKKVLEIMQNIASKIEKRAVNTKSNMNTMSLRLDETRVKMSNLTRISDVKNLVYCENLITDDHHLPSSSETQVPQKNFVRQTKEVAIANGLKLVENCFEKHKLKQDPSSSRSEETIVYRPIDQFYSSLPFLIGSDKWKDKWHLGLMEEEDRQSQAGSVYADSVDSSVVSKPNEQLGNQFANLSSSQDSLAKSINSVGDQMVINSKQVGLFEEPTLPSEPSIFKPQPSARTIVNFFDDEPPELPSNNPSPSVKRKPTNLFDDVESVESLPIYEPEINQQNKQHLTPLPPVDLFNDNDFDDFITNMEKNRNQTPKEEKVNAPKLQNEEKVIDVKPREVNVQRDMKNIADEINKKLQLKKSEHTVVKEKVQEHTPKNESTPVKVATPKSAEEAKITIVEPKIISKPEPVESKIESKPDVNAKKRIMNLFDDEDDSEDFFEEIIKQKHSNPPTTTSKSNEVPPPAKTTTVKKVSNLFDDDEEEDNDFDTIFKDKISTPKVLTLKHEKEPTNNNVARTLFDDENEVQNIKASSSSTKQNVTLSITKQPALKKLFDDDDDDNDDILFKSDKELVPQVGQTNQNNKDAILDDKLETSASLLTKGESSKDSVVENIADTFIQSNINDHENELPKSDKMIENNDENEQIINTLKVEEIPDDEEIYEKDLDKKENEVMEEPPSLNPSLTPPFHSAERNEIISHESNTSSNFNPMPLFSDEPPEDDTWDEDFNNFEETESKQPDAPSIFSANTSSYSVPIFDEFPPDDDNRNPPPIPDFDDEISDYDDKEDAQLEVPKIDENHDKRSLKEENVPENNISDTSSSNTTKPDVIGHKIESKLTSTDKEEITIIKRDGEAEKSLPGNTKTSIKSKLDMFSRPSESPPIKQNEPKRLPGKLTTSLNINVNALMPGAKIPVKKVLAEEEPTEVIERGEISKEIQSSEPSLSTGLLNNDIAKSRAKISIKRRPSTRSGRRSNYEKSVNSQIADKDEVNEPEVEKKKLPPNASNDVLPSLFAEDDEEGDFLANATAKKIDQTSSLKPQKVTTNKVSVFYDDEEETRKMLEEQKLNKDILESEPPKKEPLKLFDEVNKVDDNLILENKPTTKMSNQNLEIKEQHVHKQASLFEDDNDDDDLFGAKAPKKLAEKYPKKDNQMKSQKLFDDDEQDDLFGAPSKNIASLDKKPINKKIPPSKSLFGDESDDEDLFSTKPKSTILKSSTKSTAKSSSNVQKTLDDDPLKDLMGN